MITYLIAPLALVALLLAPLVVSEERSRRAPRRESARSLVASVARGEVAPLAIAPLTHEDELARLSLAHVRACASRIVAREGTSDARDVALAREILATCDDAREAREARS